MTQDGFLYPGPGPGRKPAPTSGKQGPGNRLWAPWSAADVFAIIGLVVFGMVVIFSIMGAAIDLATTLLPGVDGDFVNDSLLVTAAGFFLQWAVTLGVAFTYLKLRGYSFDLSTMGFRRPVSWFEAVVLVFGLLLAFYTFLGFYNSILEQLLPRLVPEPQDVGEWYGFSFAGFIIALSQVALITPVVEEMFFRGIIHRGLERRLGFVGGALLSSLVFALAHVSYTLYIPIFILGFMFAFLAHHTRSLWPSIIAHFAVNSLAVLGQFLL